MKTRVHTLLQQFLHVAICAFFALALVACTAKQETPTANEEDMHAAPPTTQLVNPFADFNSLDDAVKASGFDMVLPKTMPEGYTLSAYRALVNGDKLIEVIYKNANHEIYIRKGMVPNISGMMDSFPETFLEHMHDVLVTLKGRDGTIHVAEWKKDGFSYSIAAITYGQQESVANSGLSINVMKDLVQEMLETPQE